MSKDITRSDEVTIGLDLGDRFTEGRVLDASGEVIEAFRVRTTEPALSARVASFPPSRIVWATYGPTFVDGTVVDLAVVPATDRAPYNAEA